MTDKITPTPFALGYIRGNEVTSRFMESLVSSLFVLSGLGERVYAAACSHYLNLGRNTLIQLYLTQDTEAEVLVLVDTDHAFRPDDLLKLVGCVDREDRPIVSGLYYAPDNLGQIVRPVMSNLVANGMARTAWKKSETEGLVEVDEVGMGFCAIHRSVFVEMAEHIGPHWFDFDERENGEFMLEAAAFCRRAKLHLGKKIFVDTRIEVGHIKPIEVRARHATLGGIAL